MAHFYRYLVLLHHTKHIDFKKIEQKLYVKFDKIVMFLRFLFCLIYQREAGQNILKWDDHIYALCFCLLGIRTVNSGSKPRSDDSSSTNIYLHITFTIHMVTICGFVMISQISHDEPKNGKKCAWLPQLLKSNSKSFEIFSDSVEFQNID